MTSVAARKSAVRPGRTILCSEEDRQLWALRQPPLDFGPDLIFHAPPGDCPSRGRWKRFIDDLLELSFREDPFDLLVIDTAVRFLPLGDRNKKTLRWALAQLSLVAGFPVGVLILNQSRNVQRPPTEQIPPRGILGAAGRLQIPDRNEGFDELHYVRIDEANRFVVEDWKDEV